MLKQRLKLAFSLTLLVAGINCAPLQPPSATGPRGSEAIYPLLFTADAQKREGAMAAANQLFQTSTTGASPQLQPVTATIESLPARMERPLYLPKLGTAPIMTEEETRESLRRFIRDWRELIGADPGRLSLVARTDQPDGTKLAEYEQRPFRYAIRGGYGKLFIRFTPDRRVVNLTSTCIPDAERIQPSVAAITPKLAAEDAVTRVRDQVITYKNAAGTQSTFKLPAGLEINPRELVIYILPSPANQNALEFHVAWEIPVTGAPVKNVYLDAVTGEVIAAS
jgi:hypothetical protein